MITKRIIPCLDCQFIRGKARVVKGTRFVNIKNVGSPFELAKEYYRQGADEICFLDITASVESRKTMLEVIRKTSEMVFVPLTVGGGIKSVEDAEQAFRNGADKVTINTAALKTPQLINNISQRFGSQACVLAIDAKRQGDKWTAFIYGGRKDSGKNALEWALEAQERGAGEILLTSMDCDGTKQGYDIELTKLISEKLSIPVIASGGAGQLQDLADVVREGKADAVLAASIFHYNTYSVKQVKEFLKEKGISVRL